jgi:hypothetical protein
MAIKKFGEWCQKFNETGFATSASAAIRDYRAKASELGTAGTSGLNVLMSALQALDEQGLGIIVNKMYTLLDDDHQDIKGRLKSSFRKYIANIPTNESPK